MKIRYVIPSIIRCIAIIDVLVALYVAVESFSPKSDNEFTLLLALYIFISSIFVFAFASIVEAAETYLYQFRPKDEEDFD